MKKESYLRKATFGMGFVLLMVSAVMLQLPGTVGAQEEEFYLEDTVVTATKTGETELQKTSISMSVFDEEFLSDLGTYSLFDLETFVSSYEFAYTLTITSGWIRGIGTGSGVSLTGETGVGFYLDGVYLNQGRGANADFLDVERIEILKGPQGVLFGGNSTGGTMNFITKRPTDEMELVGRVEIGNYATRRIDARIAGPLIEGKVRASLTVMDAEHDGWIDNLSSERDARDQNDWGVRGMIQILPSDFVEITLSADYAEKEFFSTGDYEHKRINITDRQRAHMDEANAAGYPDHYLNPPDFWTTNLNAEHMGGQHELWGLALHMEFKLPHDMTLRSITGHRDVGDETIQDNDTWVHRPKTFYALGESDQTSQELSLNGTWGRLDFLVGGFYYEAYLSSPESTFGDPAGFPGTPLEGVPLGDSAVFNVEKENWALFTNLTYAVTDKLNLSAGVRYSDESKEYDFKVGMHFLQPDGKRGPLLFPIFPLIASEAGWTVWTPKFAIEYQANEDVFVFASYAEGFKGGALWGLNLLAGIPAVLPPEYVETWELGVKTDWLDKRLRVNAAIFTNDHEGSQRFLFLGGVPTFQTIGSVETTGAELEVLARPIQGLTLTANVSYLDAEYADYEDSYRFDDLGYRSVAGNQLAYIPEWKATFGASYTLTLEEAGFLTFGTNIAYRDDVPTTPFPEDPYAWKDDYTIVNATIRYETQDGRWALEGYARNLFETKYYSNVILGGDRDDGPDATHFFPGDPRRMGIRVTYSY